MALLTNVSVGFMTVTTIGVFLRMYTRKFILNNVWFDDYLAVLSWACLMSMGSINLVLVDNGMVEGANSIYMQKLLYSGLVLANAGQLFTKSTFFFQFYRIIRSTGSPLRIPYLCIMGFIFCWLAAMVILSTLPCIPVESFWDKTIQGYCPDSTPGRWMSSVGNIVTDFIILLLPVPVIWRLRVPRGQKFALGAVFGLGFFVCIVSILRLVLSLQPPNTAAPPDPSPNIAWTMAEFSIGLLIACLATLRALVARFLPSWRKVFSTAQPSQSNYGPGGRDTTTLRGKHTTSNTISSITGNWINLSDESNVEMGRLAKVHAEPVQVERKHSDDWEGSDGVMVVRGFEVKTT